MMFEDAFVDRRLEARAEQIMNAMSQHGSAVVHHCCSSPKEQIGAYRFFGNADVTEEEMVAALQRQCARQVMGKPVLAIHDTTSLNFQAHAGRLSRQDPDIGPLERAGQVGFFLHPALVVDAETAFPLGYGAIQRWNRGWNQPAKTDRQYQAQPREAKESWRGVETIRASAPVVAEAAHVTVIADRESDIYEVFAQPVEAHTDLLIRVAQNRCVEEEPGKLLTALAATPCQATYHLELPGPRSRQARTAVMEVRWRAITLHRPATASKSLPATVALWALEARETLASVPAGEGPICWRLLTTYALSGRDLVRRVLRWYQWRWLIEELLRVLKQHGLRLEASQREQGAALRKNALLALGAALPILQLTLERDGLYGVPATVVFTEDERAYQAHLGPTLEGQPQKQQNPFVPDTLAWSAWIIGRLGGWKGDRSQSPPGYITMKRGLERFADMFAGWQLAQEAIK